MKTAKYNKPKYSKKFVRVDNSTWIQVRKDIPDIIARENFLRAIAMNKPEINRI